MRFYLFLIGICVLIFSCEEKEFELKGQIFIVTQGGQNIPLGLVSIGLIDYELVNEELKGSLSVFDNEISDIEKSIEKLNIEAEYNLKKSLWDDVLIEAKTNSVTSFTQKGIDYALLDAKRKYNQFRNFVNLEVVSRDRQLEVQGVENLRNRYKLNSLVEYDLQREKINNLHSEHDLLVQELEKFSKGHSVLPPLQKKFLKTKTNSDGNFQIKLKKGKYFIFATGSRIVGTETEKYMWAQILDIENDINDFFFSNDNLVSIDEIRSIK